MFTTSQGYGAFLRGVRVSRGLSQRQLAEITGISQPNISAYEHDRRLPSIDAFNRILVACGYFILAEGGSRRLACPLPSAGWFPDEDLPPRLSDDPADTRAPAAAADDHGDQLRDLLLLTDALHGWS